MASQSHTTKRSAFNASFKLKVIGYAEINFIPILTQKIRVRVIHKNVLNLNKYGIFFRKNSSKPYMEKITTLNIFIIAQN